MLICCCCCGRYRRRLSYVVCRLCVRWHCLEIQLIQLIDIKKSCPSDKLVARQSGQLPASARHGGRTEAAELRWRAWKGSSRQASPSIGQFYLAPGVGALRGQRLSRHSFTKSTVLILLC